MTNEMNEQYTNLLEEYGFLPRELRIDTNEQFEELWNTHNKEYNKIKVFGRMCTSKRYQNCYGQPYTFSGVKMDSKPIPEYLQKYINYFNKLYGVNFNMCLLNFYEDGNHYIGMHSDNEKQIVKYSPIITITFLEDSENPRKFTILNKKTKEKRYKELKHNSYFTMKNRFQEVYKHGIPIQKKIKTKRISITLRVFK